MDFNSNLFLDIAAYSGIFLLFAYVYFFLNYRKEYKYNRLKKHALKVPAKIISISETNLFSGEGLHALPIMEVVFEMEHPKNVIRKETIRYAFNKWETIPKIGNTITILVDKTDPNNFHILKG